MRKKKNTSVPMTLDANLISTHALKILQRLHEHHYHAYIVGGGVRDLLLGVPPKDFDIATDASPEDIRHLFRNCRLIGKRFRLAHIHYGDKIIEVATFRSQSNEAADDRRHSQSGMILRDNVYGTLEDDVWRRDFTLNALYYDIRSHSVIDHTNGLADLQNRTLRLIGDPLTRYREDPVRMLRAIRFAAKLNLQIDAATESPLLSQHDLLREVSTSRLYIEIIKLLHSGASLKTVEMLKRYGLFPYLFPLTTQALEHAKTSETQQFIELALQSTDNRIQQDKSVNPAFLFAAFLWQAMLDLSKTFVNDGKHPSIARENAMDKILEKQVRSLAIPRRITAIVREIWQLQFRFEKIKSKKTERLLHHRRFRAAYDFLLLRAEIDPSLVHLATWWTNLQQQVIFDEFEEDDDDEFPLSPFLS